MRNIEEQEQITVFGWARMQENVRPELKQLYHVPNGGYRTKATAARLKASGVKAGVPDMCLPVPRRGYHGLYIELKRTDGGTVSPAQKAWIQALNDNGYLAVICKGAGSAIATLMQYLGG